MESFFCSSYSHFDVLPISFFIVSFRPLLVVLLKLSCFSIFLFFFLNRYLVYFFLEVEPHNNFLVGLVVKIFQRIHGVAYQTMFLRSINVKYRESKSPLLKGLKGDLFIWENTERKKVEDIRKKREKKIQTWIAKCPRSRSEPEPSVSKTIYVVSHVTNVFFNPSGMFWGWDGNQERNVTLSMCLFGNTLSN